VLRIHSALTCGSKTPGVLSSLDEVDDGADDFR
jgi:hypothetical protein